MIQQTIFPFKIESTKERLTAHGTWPDGRIQSWNWVKGAYGPGLASPRNNRGFVPSVIVDNLVVMLQGEGRRLEDLQDLNRRRGQWD